MLYIYLKIFIATDITNPSKPMPKIPKAEIFAIDLNSSPLGFLKTCHTLWH